VNRTLKFQPPKASPFTATGPGAGRLLGLLSRRVLPVALLLLTTWATITPGTPLRRTALSLICALLTALLWPSPAGQPTSSANTGARYLGVTAMALSLLPLPATLNRLNGHLPLRLTDALFFLGEGLLFGALVLHRLAWTTRAARTRTPGERFLNGQGRTGPLRFSRVRVKGLKETRGKRGVRGQPGTAAHPPLGRVILARGPGAAYLTVVCQARPGAHPGMWEVDHPPLANRPGGLLEVAARLNAKPVMLAVPPRTQGPYSHQSVLSLPYTVLFGTPDEQHAQLQELFSMHQRLQEQDVAPVAAVPAPAPETGEEAARKAARQHGRDTERQATADVRAALPNDWKLRTGVVLSAGGDADLELTRPDGRVFVVEIKSRRDLPARPGDDVPGPGRATWPDLADQARLAARQLGGTPVLWQPLAPERSGSVTGTLPGGAAVTVLGGSAAWLLARLSQHP